MGIIAKFNVCDSDYSLIKSDCEFIAVIRPGEILSPSEVSRYYGTSPSHPYYERHRGPHSCRKLVFDKCVVSSSASIIETVDGMRVRL